MFDGILIDTHHAETAEGGEIELSADTYTDGADIAWTSSDTSIAEVDEDGVVTAKSEGTATITASSGYVSDECEVVVYGIGDWYDSDETSYEIDSAEELLDVAELVSSGVDDFTYKTVTLTEDINLDGIDWLPIGYDIYLYDDYTPYFDGTFDGGNHTVSNLTNSRVFDFAAFFARIGSEGTVKNVRLEDMAVTSEYCAAGICGYNAGSIINCYADGDISAGKYDCLYAGGICAYNDGDIINCSSYADISSEIMTYAYEYIGGCVGVNEGTVKNCVSSNEFAVTAYYSSGEGTSSSYYLYLGGTAGANAAKISNTYWENSSASDVSAYTLSGYSQSGNYEFSGTEIAETVTVGDYEGSDLIDALNYYTIDYKDTSGDKDLMYWWEYDDSISFKPTLSDADTVVQYGDLYFDTATGTVTECDTDVSGTVTVPSVIEDVAVTGIGTGAFYYCIDMTDIEIPKTLTQVGDRAFYGCYALENVYFDGYESENAITADDGNEIFTSATWIYNAEETASPTATATATATASPTATATASPTVTVPSAPYLTVSDITETSVTVEWSAPDDNGGSEITEYVIYCTRTSDGVCTSVNITDTEVSTYTITGLESGVEYEIKICAVNEEGIGDSASQTITTAATDDTDEDPANDDNNDDNDGGNDISSTAAPQTDTDSDMPYTIDDIVLDDNGETAYVEFVRNTSDADGENTVVILSVYSGGALVSVQIKTMTSESNLAFDYQSGDEVKAFIWDLKSMEPLSAAKNM
ncbi:MAG: fibronectin type III domain-containing protein [Firmicutes bacterium]|nr:fibronectin type III domain-containing protein [Bacillota bacterium]